MAREINTAGYLDDVDRVGQGGDAFEKRSSKSQHLYTRRKYWERLLQYTRHPNDITGRVGGGGL